MQLSDVEIKEDNRNALIGFHAFTAIMLMKVTKRTLTSILEMIV